ncbi:hypothetical protein EON63_09030 [archaeon]|nr:MAG: hypothetical protein EON63_09030 [archaeon]
MSLFAIKPTTKPTTRVTPNITLPTRLYSQTTPPTSNTVQNTIAKEIQTALAKGLGDEAYRDIDPMISIANSRHGDLQSNVAMSLGKRARKSPREIAKIVGITYAFIQRILCVIQHLPTINLM